MSDDIDDLTLLQRQLWSCFFQLFQQQFRRSSNNSRNISKVASCWFRKQFQVLKGFYEYHSRETSGLSLDLLLYYLENTYSSSCGILLNESQDTKIQFLNEPPVVNSEFAKKIHEKLKEFPGFVLSQRDSVSETLFLNDSFRTKFDFNENDMNQIVHGFLPCAADILSLLMVCENELIVFLRIMCMKFDHCEKGSIRNIPSVHTFSFWTKSSKGLWQQESLTMHFNIQISFFENHSSSQISVVFFEKPISNKTLEVSPISEPKPCYIFPKSPKKLKHN